MGKEKSDIAVGGEHTMKCGWKVFMHNLFLNIKNLIEKPNNWNVVMQHRAYLRSLVKYYGAV